MKILFTSTGNDLNAVLDPRFGRAAKFLIYDLDNDSFEIFDNSVNIAAAHGAGIAAAESVCNLGVEAVVTGNCGPNAFAALTAAGIKVFTVAQGTIVSLLEAYKNGELEESQTANVTGHWTGGEMNMDAQNKNTELNDNVRTENSISGVAYNPNNPYCTGQRLGRAWGGIGQGRGRGFAAGTGRGAGMGLGHGLGPCGRGMARGFGAGTMQAQPGVGFGRGLGGGRGMGMGGGRGLGRSTGLGRCVNPDAGRGFGRGMNK